VESGTRSTTHSPAEKCIVTILGAWRSSWAILTVLVVIHQEFIDRLLDGVEASILHLSLVGFALPLCLSQSYDLGRGTPTSGVIPSNNPAHQEIYQTCVMIDPIL
jgi:hypothetical protein